MLTLKLLNDKLCGDDVACLLILRRQEYFLVAIVALNVALEAHIALAGHTNVRFVDLWVDLALSDALLRYFLFEHALSHATSSELCTFLATLGAFLALKLILTSNANGH